MAWTTPRNWTSGETVTAALLNTHLRDNLLETAPATVTAAGDIVYASAANALGRLAVGNNAQVLVPSGGAPSWSSTIGDASNNAGLILKGPNPTLRLSETDATDPADWWQFGGQTDNLQIHSRDDSAATFIESMDLTVSDYVLHTGAKGTGTGAVVIATDASGTTTALSTTGTTYLSATIATGGAAYVEGFWEIEIERVGAGSSETISILPREDGANLSGWFQRGSQEFLPDALAAVGDNATVSGMFWRRLTAADSSTYQLFLSTSVDSMFQINDGHMYVRSIQYPT